MLSALKAARCKYWLRKRGFKLATPIYELPKEAVLTLEEGCSIGEVQTAFKTLNVGAMTYVRSESELLNVSQIGRFCSIGNEVVIGQEKAGHPLNWVSSHPFQYTRTELQYSSPGVPAEIGHDVWIGRKAMIMEGVKVSIGAVIAARALVTRDVPPYAIVAGVPARIISYRHPPQVVAGLLSSHWWELPLELLQHLPLDDAWHFLSLLVDKPPSGRAVYKKVEVSRQGCREMVIGTSPISGR